MADATYRPPEIVGEIVKLWDKEKKHHDGFVKKYERAERAYRGIMSWSEDSAKWRHHYSPMYAFNLIETIISSTTEMGLSFDVNPAPRPNQPLDQAMHMVAQAESVADLLRHENREDGMDYKQRPLFLTACLGGRGILKNYWDYRTGPVRKQSVTLHDVPAPDGSPTGLQIPHISYDKAIDVVRDHSCSEVIDPRDFVVNESAKALQPYTPGGAQYLFHRCWYSMEQLRMMEAADYVSNVDKLADSGRGIDWQDEYGDRERQLWDINRAKDLVECLEYWKFADGVIKRAMVGNRMILLRDTEDSPFEHGEYPFSISSSMSQPFVLQGVSDMELIEQLQAMLWEITNQRLDNVELINNWITLIRSDVEDPDAFEFYPGARWPVESPDDVTTLQPPYQLLEGTIPVEGQIRTDLQNVTGATPFAGGTELSAVQQNTATGASLVMNAAQARMASKKYMAQKGLMDSANQRLKNCRQFITDKRLIHTLGPDGVRLFREIDPVDIDGEFVAELKAIGESQLRQEKRAEATQFAQVVMSMAPMAAASGVPLNIKEVIKYMVDQWGIEGADRFFSVQPQSLGAVDQSGGQSGPGGGAAPPGGGPNLGITSGRAMDASSPSAQGGLSMSPVIALQRAFALTGGANNAPRGR